jgi:hypothetical protein
MQLAALLRALTAHITASLYWSALALSARRAALDQTIATILAERERTPSPPPLPISPSDSESVIEGPERGGPTAEVRALGPQRSSASGVPRTLPPTKNRLPCLVLLALGIRALEVALGLAHRLLEHPGTGVAAMAAYAVWTLGRGWGVLAAHGAGWAVLAGVVAHVPEGWWPDSVRAPGVCWGD